MGPLHRALGVLARDVKRRALVEHKRDVGAERGLDRHRRLRGQEALAAVNVGAKADAFLVDGENRPGLGPGDARATAAAATLVLAGPAPVAHREPLKAARVGDDWAVPAHELV